MKSIQKAGRKSSILILTLMAVIAAFISGFSWVQPAEVYTADSYVYKVLDDMGNPRPAGYMENITEKMIEQGREMVFNGHTDDPAGGKSKYISLYYVCTNCHNTVIEDPVLSKMDPVGRLDYAKQNKLPFLQGTTFYGATDRESWYNGDYYKKYGDLVKPANKDIREAIQLCAQECSKGRVLEKWEEEAILAYFYSIGYKLSDIFSADEIDQLNAKVKNKSNHPSLISMIKSKYALYSPATFVEPPYETQNELQPGNADNGKAIFELSCLTCHKPYGCSDNVFDDTKFTFNKFARDFDKDYWWLYQIIRHGQYSYPGHEPYMPHFTAERMTNQQVEDLKAYFMQGAS